MNRKIFSLILIFVLCLSLSVNVLAESAALPADEYLVFDDANLLTDSEERALTEKLYSIGQKYHTQLIACTIQTIDGADIDQYIDDLYDYMDFGYGNDMAGVVVLICMEPQQVAVFSNASLSSDNRDAIRSAITPSLSSGNYAAALELYAEKCEYYLEGMLNGLPFNFVKNLIICLIIGFFVGLIVAMILKGQLKSVVKQNQANVYVRPNSMQLTVRNDFFLYRTVSRKQKSSNSSSSSSPSRGSSSGSF